jgi:hypothetical protein
VDAFNNNDLSCTVSCTQKGAFHKGKLQFFFFLRIRDGGEGGIRTRVGVFSPQTAFEAAPLRPLRYLSGVVSVKLKTVKQLKLGADGPEKTVAAGPLLPLP